MKKFITALAIGFAVAAISSSPSIEWVDLDQKIGEVKVNQVKKLNFDFTNKSTEPISILEAKGSCGCTVVELPKEKVNPGESASIKAEFRSSKTGVFRKSIKVKTSNSDKYTYLYFSGEVIE